MAIELYHTNWSICAQKVRLVIAEKGIEVIEHHIDLREREQQTPEYLKLNPNGYVPTLVHGGRAIIESSIIFSNFEAAVFLSTSSTAANSPDNLSSAA